MAIEIISEHLNGIKVIKPKVFTDERGFFMESFRADEFIKHGLPTNFVQDNHSRSARNVLRGMHFQWSPPQSKLIRVTIGSAYVVEIDVRLGSPTFGKWFAIELSAENKLQLWVPFGFANGFCGLSQWIEMQYKCTGIWNRACESNIRWSDPDVGIRWPVDNPILSDKDRTAQTLAQWISREESKLITY